MVHIYKYNSFTIVNTYKDQSFNVKINLIVQLNELYRWDLCPFSHHWKAVKRWKKKKWKISIFMHHLQLLSLCKVVWIMDLWILFGWKIKLEKTIYSYFLFGSNKTLTFFIFGCEVLEIYNTCIQYKFKKRMFRRLYQSYWILVLWM